MPCSTEYGDSSLHVSAVSLSSDSLLDPGFLELRTLRITHLPVHPPMANLPSMRITERRETQKQKNKEVHSSLLHPPAKVSHCGEDLFLPSLAESSVSVCQI
ncbi:hypothetical protein CRENBAI_001672 [Crenichthys baileyi]|uniref:Uncharacterized protein n=1 Tax=Crenichthys baileyi TaxID=28760 RepID=A0AAV9RVW3_9TELE